MDLRELEAHIAQNRDDLAARHVLADALLERGDPRGAFISEQLEIGGLITPGDWAARSQLQPDMRKIEREHDEALRQRWIEPIVLTQKDERAWFFNGAVEFWECVCATFVSGWP